MKRQERILKRVSEMNANVFPRKETVSRISARRCVYRTVAALSSRAGGQKSSCYCFSQRIETSPAATNGVCYATVAEREIADVFTCIKHGAKLHTTGRLLTRNSQRHVRSPEEMARLFADTPCCSHLSLPFNLIRLQAAYLILLARSLKRVGEELASR